MESQEIKLAGYINQLSITHKKFTDMGGDIVQANNQTRYVIDLLAFAVVNRSIQLVDGFVTLVNTNNYIAAIPLIRLQLDNALRFFAIMQVNDPNDFYLYFMDGKPVNHYKSGTGEKLSDNYLATTLDAVFPGVLKLYKDTSDYIHLSRQHVHATKHLDEGESESTTIGVGKGLNPYSLDAKIHFAATMLEVGKLVLIVLDRWKRTKQKFPEIDPATTRSIMF